MKYVVDVNGTRHGVDVDGLSATLCDEPMPGPAHASSHAVAELGPADGTPLRLLRIGDQVVRVMARRGDGRGVYTFDIDGYTYVVEAVDERTRVIRDMAAKSAAASGPAPLKAPMPGLIVRVNVAVGDRVQPGQGLIVMEAMKMENELRASAAGVVKVISVGPGTAVEKGALLIELAGSDES